MAPTTFTDLDTTTIDPLEFTTTMTPATEAQSPLSTLVTALLGGNPLMTASTTTPATTTTTLTIDDETFSFPREHLEHKKITFEIPTHRDLEHIESIHNFNTLLKRIGNAVTYDATQFTGAALHETTLQQQQNQNQQHLLTNAEISKSVVLDLADLKANADDGFGFERFFAGADMHSIINYLWIGVVTSLVILSVIFIVFSCYFYRKFREWKKCNKDIRAHLNDNDMNAHHTNNSSNNNHNNNNNNDDEQNTRGNMITNYYQMESPPCYTIATGLPTYDEALLHKQPLHQHHHHYHQQQQNCFSYALKYMYPTLSTVHHTDLGHAIVDGCSSNNLTISTPPTITTQTTPTTIALDINDDRHFNGNWKKISNTNIEAHKMLQFRNTEYDSHKICQRQHQEHQYQNQHQNQHQQQQEQQHLLPHHQQQIKVSTSLLEQSSPIPSTPQPPAYDVAASVALLSGIGDYIENIEAIHETYAMRCTSMDYIIKQQQQQQQHCQPTLAVDVVRCSSPLTTSMSASSSSMSAIPIPPSPPTITTTTTLIDTEVICSLEKSLNSVVIA